MSGTLPPEPVKGGIASLKSVREIVRYADITYVINRIRSVVIESDLSIEDEYQIYRLENLVHFP